MGEEQMDGLVDGWVGKMDDGTPVANADVQRLQNKKGRNPRVASHSAVAVRTLSEKDMSMIGNVSTYMSIKDPKYQFLLATVH